MFKDKLKQLRIKNNLTQADLAKAIGVSSATIGNYEQGTREPRNNEMRKKLADFFGISVDELMDMQNKHAKRIIQIYKSDEEEIAESLCSYRTDKPITYNNIDITNLVHLKEGESISITPEQRRANIEFSSRSGHAMYARRVLLEIIYKIKKSSNEDIITNLFKISENIENNVVYWYNRCWNNISDVFPKVSDIESLYDLINTCLIIDDAAIKEFYFVDIPDNFDWLREKLRN